MGTGLSIPGAALPWLRGPVGGLEIDDVAKQNFAFVELVTPDDDGLEGQRALAQSGDHGLAAGLDALGDGDFALARQQLDRAHLAQIHADGIIGAVGRLRARLRLGGHTLRREGPAFLLVGASSGQPPAPRFLRRRR